MPLDLSGCASNNSITHAARILKDTQIAFMDEWGYYFTFNTKVGWGKIGTDRGVYD